MSPYRIEFDWDPRKEASNRAKHGVAFELALTVFQDPFAATILDEDHGEDEERRITISETADGTPAMVIHTWMEADQDHAVVRRLVGLRSAKRGNTGKVGHEARI